MSSDSSESEGEARRRIEMASCVMNAAEVLASAPPSKRRKSAPRQAPAVDGEEQDGGEVQNVDRPFRRMSIERLHLLLAKSFDARLADGVWGAVDNHDGSTSTLMMFASSVQTQRTNWPPPLPELATTPPVDDNGSTTSLAIVVQQQHVARAARQVLRPLTGAVGGVALPVELRTQLANLSRAERVAVAVYLAELDAEAEASNADAVHRLGVELTLRQADGAGDGETKEERQMRKAERKARKAAKRERKEAESKT